MEQGSKINWKVVMFGGAAVVVVLILVMRSGATTNPPTNSTPSTASDSTTSNTGTPSATSNNSLVGFTDPATGIQWIMDQAGNLAAVGGNGTGLPATYTAGTAIGTGISPVPSNMGGPESWWNYNSLYNIAFPSLPRGSGVDLSSLTMQPQ